MFSKSALAVVSVVATTVLAQNYPTDLSEPCLNFYKAFDADTSFKSCTSSLNSATAGYNASSNPTKESITSSLNSVCGPAQTNDKCSDDVIRAKLADFSTACRQEFDAKRPEVIATYDSIYVLSPLKAAMCAKDDAGNYCVTTTSTYAQQNPALTEGLKQQLFSTADSPANFTAMGAAGVPFLFLSPALDATSLCGSCSKNILMGYLRFAKQTPHAAGLDNSQLLSGETKLFAAVNEKCPASFLSDGELQGVSGLGKGASNNNGAKTHAFDIALVAGVVSTLAVAAYL